jgi:hypothetical protein
LSTCLHLDVRVLSARCRPPPAAVDCDPRGE